MGQRSTAATSRYARWPVHSLWTLAVSPRSKRRSLSCEVYSCRAGPSGSHRPALAPPCARCRSAVLRYPTSISLSLALTAASFVTQRVDGVGAGELWSSGERRGGKEG